MKRADLLASLADEILKRKRATAPLRVGIDGRCASGKTTLADELASTITLRQPELEILRPSVDGFHHMKAHRYRQGEYSPRGYYEDAFDYQAVVECVLRPLSSDKFPVLCRQVAHDWRTDMAHDAPPVSVGANTVLLFDGVFLFRRELDPYWDLRVLVEVDVETSIDRAVQRDASDERDAIERKYRLRYEPAWLIYLEQERPHLKADLIVNNRDVFDPEVFHGGPDRMLL
jgi:uridine kinase